MYNGYRLKINGVVFPFKYVSKGSYSCVTNNRVISTWKDANQVEHQIIAPAPKVVIKFNIIEHLSAEHSAIVQFFAQMNNVTVEYYDDRLDKYTTANCRITPITWKEISADSAGILYNKCAVTITEN